MASIIMGKKQTKAERQAALPHVVVAGNPFDGLTIYGPFENADAATQYGEDHDHGDDWWVVPCQTPDN